MTSPGTGNNEKFLQPLRKRGTKIVLGILSNGDITGVAQLSKQGAKDFARELAQYCKAYNLDGVCFDDEYEGAYDPNNPALTECKIMICSKISLIFLN